MNLCHGYVITVDCFCANMLMQMDKTKRLKWQEVCKRLRKAEQVWSTILSEEHMKSLEAAIPKTDFNSGKLYRNTKAQDRLLPMLKVP